MSRYYLKQINVLVVDNQDFVRSMLRHVLGILGCRRITEATDGEAAWDKIVSRPPDLLLVDWEMAGTDGLTLVERVRNDDNSPDKCMPIIMLTAHTDPHRINIARNAGVNEFVTKPIKVNTLFNAIARVIENPRPFIRTQDYFGPDRRDGKDRRKAAQGSHNYED